MSLGEPSAEAVRIALITAPDGDVAHLLARAFVERSLAACVNLVPSITSVYRWQGAVEEAGEVLMIVKTSAARIAELEAALGELHPYDVPEFVVLEPAHVADGYLRWLLGETRSPPDA